MKCKDTWFATWRCLALLSLVAGCTQETETASDGGPSDAALSGDGGGPADGAADGAADEGTPPEPESPIPLDWVALPAGTFQMGSEAYETARPVHPVTVASFTLTRAEITVAQYRACREASGCPPARAVTVGNTRCDLTEAVDEYPMRCVTPDEARAFAAWVGARLPTEAEWEYAARSGGLDQPYPWGQQPPSCNRAVVREPDGPNPELTGREGCGTEDAWPVCSKPAGNSQQGLCDMIGNVAEWVEDEFCSYEVTPTDGSAARCDSTTIPVRGGHWYNDFDAYTATRRGGRSRDGRELTVADEIGFRIARSLPSAE